MQSITRQRFEIIRALYDEASALNAADRTRLIAERCAGDEELRLLVEELLSADAVKTPVLAPLDAGLPPGRLIGPYRVDRLIGKGGMGAVYLARRTDGAFEKEVALKVMSAGLDSVAFRRHFARERHILARLEHPAIARILDGGTSNEGIPYLVMEYVNGEPIDVAARDMALSEKLRTFLPVCAAVTYAHANLIVHRDLKPSNILVTSAGEAKLLDFGVAKVMEQAEPDGMTQTITLGTPRYASPEQLLGHPPAAASDIYSLGVILYELLTGAWPYSTQSNSLLETVEAVRQQDPVRPSSRLKEPEAKALRGDLDEILLKAVSRDISRRYHSVDALRRDLEAYLSGLPVSARRGSRIYRYEKFLRRNRAGVTAAVLVAATLAGGVVSTVSQAKQARHEKQIAEQERNAARTARRLAEEQSQLAVRRAQEAEVQRREAERLGQMAAAEKTLAIGRAGELRELSRVLLFDFHDSIRNLAGAAPAKQLLLDRSRKYLETLSRDAATGGAASSELAEVHDRMGDLQMTGFHSEAKSPGPLASYQAALAIRQSIYRSSPTLENHRSLVLSVIKTGDGYFAIGDNPKALQHYEQGIAEARRSGGDQGYLLAQAMQRICNVLPSMGRAKDAEATCRECIQLIASPSFVGGIRLEIPYLLMTTRTNLGLALRLQGRTAEALEQFVLARAQIRRIYESDPSHAVARAADGVIGLQIAAVYAARQDLSAAAPAYAEAIAAMRNALEINPTDKRLARTLAFALMRQSQALLAAKRNGEAEVAMSSSLQLHRSWIDAPGAGPNEWNEFADALNKAPFPALRDPMQALRYARKAVDATREKNPFCLDTLAWALYRSGDPVKAAEASRKALALLSPAQSLLRTEIESGLREFHAAAGR